MIANFLSRPPLHLHAEPAQRLLAVEQLPQDSAELAHLLAADAAPEVRIAAARRCATAAVLATAWETETDPAVQLAIASALGQALAVTQDSACVQATLGADHCTDALRADVARSAVDPERRRAAIGHIRDEAPLIDLALGAEHAETRLAAAERVRTSEGLHRLVDAAKDKDRGVARLARQRIDAINDRQRQQAQAEGIISRLEVLAADPGPILTGVVELDRRWQALDMSGDADRVQRYGVARGTVQARFDKEQETQRSRVQFERRLREILGAIEAQLGPAALSESDALTGLRADLAALRAEAQQRNEAAALLRLEEAEQRIAIWVQQQQGLAAAQALVIEAEQLAAGASDDAAQLLARWQAMNLADRTPDLTRRFEAAVLVIEKRRLDQMQAQKQEASARRHRLHGLLHDAEQALAAGQLQAARAAADAIKPLKAGAAGLPKPTLQRLGRLAHQLSELERWESFGQHNARVQLCERAQAIPTRNLDAPQLAREVQTLRKEWKALDEQHAGVPKALWERFDGACEKAYAPAAKHFAELAARNKEARRRRKEFVAASGAHAQTLLGEPRDWRDIERWLRETDRTWREGDLGSVNPQAWKSLDAGLKAALAPLRDAQSVARDEARASRQKLIEEAAALASNASERDALPTIRTIQARWQEQAKTLPLRRRDETALWEQFRAACDAVFNARQARRKEVDGRKNQARCDLEDLCARLEQLALGANPGSDAGGTDPAAAMDDQAVRRTLRELQGQWSAQFGAAGPVLRDLEPRFKKANAAVDAALSARARYRGAAVWKTLAAKERSCDALDTLIRSGTGMDESGATTMQEQWLALPALPRAWEQKMIARRDAALRALSDEAAAGEYRAQVDRGTQSRSAGLVELELALGLDSPAQFQAERLALQVKQLKERFQGSAEGRAVSPGERLLAWCAQPGVCSAPDRDRCERILAQIEKTRSGS